MITIKSKFHARLILTVLAFLSIKNLSAQTTTAIYLNPAIVFFGISLLFFVMSAFWMFLPKTALFKRGLYFTFAGIVLTIILIIL